jgi:hypothetical protein
LSALSKIVGCEPFYLALVQDWIRRTLDWPKVKRVVRKVWGAVVGLGGFLGYIYAEEIKASLARLSFPPVTFDPIIALFVVLMVVGSIAFALNETSRLQKKPTRNGQVPDPKKIPLIEPTEKSVSGFTPEQERRLLKFGFHSLIQRQLTEIETRLDFQNPKPIEFKAWSDFREDVRKQYIDDLRTYETIEKIAKVLDTWNEAVNRASVLRVGPNSGTIHLCIQSFRAYHDELKRLSFLI